ncbi:MAG TPA: DMT family transporter [Steroidobacteraceae bacterium]|nr:DMT family transporter [Steroidobacteraceae bacterium]
MPVHKLSGRWKLGLGLALLTAALWGMLPVALSIVLQAVDPFTITWFRFLTAAIGLGVILALLGRLPQLGAIGGRGWALLLVALAGLLGNFVLYLVALTYASPTINQVVTQLSPILLMLGGIVVFHERFTVRQWLGFVLLLIGLPLFFNERLPLLVHIGSGLGHGVALLVLASLVWAIYGLAQKYLLRRMQAQQVLVLLYAGSTLALLPFAHPGRIAHVSTVQAWLLAFACANTVLAYGAFAEALRHWEASRVGATLTLTPLFTIATMWVVERIAPGLVRPEELNVPSLVGAGVVVGGSMLCALGNPALAARPAAKAELNLGADETSIRS